MPKMRLGWYAGVSTALAGSVVLSAFHQRANFYSAMVYLAQSNFCLLVLVNFTLLLYSSFVYGLSRVFFGPLRAIEVEQLTERAWFAITETCLAMTIFREEIGAWFLVMFTALVTGKVWGWIGDGRVEIFEQQPPANPRLFHFRLIVSLSLSFLYDIYILRYTINTVIQQARPNMMVMFLFEFALLATSSWRTGARYALSIAEQNIQEVQKRKRLEERRQEVREEREAMIRQREAAEAAGEEVSDAPLPNEDDIDEMDIEVPGWSSKGEWVLWLDLATDMIKLGIYVAFFAMLLTFYGLPIHIMRDLFMTSRDFVKRLNALLRYRRAIQEMNRYPDATQEDLSREDTCIICREEMRPWDPTNNPGAIDRIRPKKLPCGHILHLGCLKSWLERQQVCPTCRRPVTSENARAAQGRAAGLRIEIGGRPQQAQQQPPADGGNPPAQNQQGGDGQGAGQERRGPRVFNFGPIRFGFGANNQQVRELAQQFGMPRGVVNQGQPQVPADPPAAPPTPVLRPVGSRRTTTSRYAGGQGQAVSSDNMQNIGSLLQQADQMLQQEIRSLQATQQELQTLHLLNSELQRLRQRQQLHEQPMQGQGQPAVSPNAQIAQPSIPQFHFQAPPQLMTQLPGLPPFMAPGSRPQSSVLGRHTAPAATAAIPAGSSDLPDGVVLPPGWSLLPLQRMDGNQASTHNSTQPSPQTETQNAAVDPTQIIQPLPTTVPTTEGTTTLEPQEQHQPSVVPPPGDTTSNPSTEAPRMTRSMEHPTVMAPSPRMPNWGGSAQLFTSSSRSDQGDAASQSGLRSDTPEEQHATNDLAPLPVPAIAPTSPAKTQEEQDQEGEESDDSSVESSNNGNSTDEAEVGDKGKGKAATVEDADDDEDDDDSE